MSYRRSTILQQYAQIDRGRDARLHKEMHRRGWVNELGIVPMGMREAQRLIEYEQKPVLKQMVDNDNPSEQSSSGLLGRVLRWFRGDRK